MGNVCVMRGEGGRGQRECDEEERKREMDRSGRGTGDEREGLNPVPIMESATWEFIMCCATTVGRYVHIYLCIYVYVCIYIPL